MTLDELRSKYLHFMEQHGHTIVPSSPLVPENDPTTLFTGSGMQPMVPYLLGQPHPLGNRITDSQKCFRSQDIEEVGDNRHTTFFEMLGNWSLGEYFKQEQLRWFFTFLVDELKLEPTKLYVSVFGGSDEIGIPKDTESVEIWKKLFQEKGITAIDVDDAQNNGIQDGRIFYYSEKKNWWSRAGEPSKMPVGEPGGPDSEVFYDFGAELKLHEHSPWKNEPCHPNCDCGRFLEIGNSVFMEYIRTDKGFEPLPQKNVDFGGGLERILAAVNGDPDVFNTEAYQQLIAKVEELSGRKYSASNEETKRSFRVIADHIKAAVMLASDGVFPGNKQQGYFSRRLIRRAVRYGKMIGIDQPFISEFVTIVAELYRSAYPNVVEQQELITTRLEEEEKKFNVTIAKGLREFERLVQTSNESQFTPAFAFKLYETYGFPLELSWEEANRRELVIVPESLAQFTQDFEKQKQHHSDQSRTASAGMFKGGLQDHSETTTKYHTATHLLHAALRKLLGDSVQQKGSNITVERLRFDFSFERALTDQEKKQVEKQINAWIDADLRVSQQVMKKEDALASGAIAFFIEKYPEEVSVYTVGSDPDSDWVSKEFCGGPHVTHTGEIGHIKIQKEQSVSAGVRRIYIVLAE